MPEFTTRNEFDCDEDTYWEHCQLSEEFNRRLYLETLKFPGWKLLEEKIEGGKRIRRIHIDPPLGSLPGPAKKVIGDKFSYVEEGVYDPATHRYTFKVVPSAMGDKSKTTGELWTEKLGDKKIARHAKIHVEVKVFMVGGMVEDKIIGDLRHSYDAAASFIKQYLAEKGL